MLSLSNRPDRRLSLDKNVGTTARDRLRSYGHDTLRIEDSTLRDDAEDPEVAMFARGCDRIVVTCDASFEQVRPSDLSPPRISRPTPRRVESSLRDASGGLDIYPHPTKPRVAFMSGTAPDGHNGIVKFHTRDYSRRAVRLAVDNVETYLRMNDEGYLKNRFNTTTPPVGLFSS